MTHKEIIRTVLHRTGITQNQLAQKVGIAHSCIHRKMFKYKDIHLGSFVEIMEALGYEVVVREKRTKHYVDEIWVRG